MRQQRTSSVVMLSVIVLLSLLYLLLPSDPISSAIKDLVFGVDNRLAGTSSVDSNSTTNRVQELEAENERLRAELGFAVYDAYETVAGSVVAKNVQNYRATIDINVGSDHGVELSDAVLAQGQLIGRVVDVSSNRSRVLTMTDPDFRAAAIIENTNIEGLVRAAPGGVILEQIPDKQAADQAGARVVTSGLGGVFPPGLLLGLLGDDISAENAIFREFVLESTVSVGEVREVVVLK